MDKWINYNFKSSTIITEEFKEFAKSFKKYIKSLLSRKEDKLILHSFNMGHFYLSGFIKKDDKFVYFSTLDVRYSPYSWVDNILIRTAKSGEDYTGGSNYYTHLINFKEDVNKLL